MAIYTPLEIQNQLIIDRSYIETSTNLINESNLSLDVMSKILETLLCVDINKCFLFFMKNNRYEQIQNTLLNYLNDNQAFCYRDENKCYSINLADNVAFLISSYPPLENNALYIALFEKLKNVSTKAQDKHNKRYVYLKALWHLANKEQKDNILKYLIKIEFKNKLSSLNDEGIPLFSKLIKYFSYDKDYDVTILEEGFLNYEKNKWGNTYTTLVYSQIIKDKNLVRPSDLTRLMLNSNNDNFINLALKEVASNPEVGFIDCLHNIYKNHVNNDKSKIYGFNLQAAFKKYNSEEQMRICGFLFEVTNNELVYYKQSAACERRNVLSLLVNNPDISLLPILRQYINTFTVDNLDRNIQYLQTNINCIKYCIDRWENNTVVENTDYATIIDLLKSLLTELYDINKYSFEWKNLSSVLNIYLELSKNNTEIIIQELKDIYQNTSIYYLRHLIKNTLNAIEGVNS